MPRRAMVVAKHSFSYPKKESFRLVVFTRFFGFQVGKTGLKLEDVFGGAFWAFWRILTVFPVLAKRENTVIYNVFVPSA